MDRRAQDAALHPFPVPVPLCLWLVCAETRREPVSARCPVLRSGSRVEADDYHVAVRLVAVGLLAAESTCGAQRFGDSKTLFRQAVAAHFGEDPLIPSLRGQRLHYFPRAGPFICRRFGGGHAAARSCRQCSVVLRGLPSQGLLAGSPGRLLPAPGNERSPVETGGGGRCAPAYFRLLPLASRGELPHYGLALVSRLSCAGNRICAGGPPGDGGPLRLHAASRHLCNRSLAACRTRFDCPAAFHTLGGRGR